MQTVMLPLSFYLFLLPVLWLPGFINQTEKPRVLLSCIFLICSFFIIILNSLTVHRKSKTFGLSVIHIVIVALFSFTAVSTVLSLNPTLAFWGSLMRPNNSLLFLSIILLLILFFSLVWKSIGIKKDILLYAVLGLAANGIYGISTYVFSLNPKNISTLRALSIEINPIQFGLLMLVGIFLSSILIAQVQLAQVQRLTRLLYILLILFAVGLLFSYSRGVWFSLLCSMAVFTFLYKSQLKILSIFKKYQYIILLGGVAILLFYKPIYARLKPLLELSSQTSQHIRFLEIQDSLRLAQSKSILFGIGPSHLPFYFPLFRSAKHNETQEWTLYPSQIRNNYLDLLISYGPFTLLSFIMILVAVAWIFVKHLRKEKNDGLLQVHSLFFAGWVGILVYGQFYYYNTAAWIYFALFTSFLLTQINPRVLFRIRLTWLLFRTALLFSLAVLIMFLLITVQETRAVLIFYNGSIFYDKIGYVQTSQDGRINNILFAKYNFSQNDIYNLQTAIKYYKEALKISPYENLLYKRQYLFSLALLGRHTDSANYYDNAYYEVSQIVQKHPYDYFNFHLRSDIAYRMALDGIEAEDNFKKALKDLHTVSQLDPSNPLTLDNLGLLYRDAGDLSASTAAFKNAINLKKKYVNAYIHLGEVYESQGNKEEALKIYQEGLKIFPGNDLLDKKTKELQSKL